MYELQKFYLESDTSTNGTPVDPVSEKHQKTELTAGQGLRGKRGKAGGTAQAWLIQGAKHTSPHFNAGIIRSSSYKNIGQRESTRVQTTEHSRPWQNSRQHIGS